MHLEVRIFSEFGFVRPMVSHHQELVGFLLLLVFSILLKDNSKNGVLPSTIWMAEYDSFLSKICYAKDKDFILC